MSIQQEKFIKVLEEMFQFDQADLDFGIYRIMNQKRDEVTRFLNDDLVPQIKDAFEKYKNADVETIKEDISKLEKQLADMGVAKESSEKYISLQKQLNKGADIGALENEVFSDLTNFFKRYYYEGDFLSLRRYKKDVFAVPYEGEEVKLHWSNADQYYVKSSEHFRDYTFRLPSGKKVHFKLVDASTEQNNNKVQEGKERKFILLDEDPLIEDNGELTICFEYRPDNSNRKREKINEETVERIYKENGFSEWIEELGVLTPTEKNKKRTLLEKHLNDYTAKNSFDYFIHKDLGGFLRRELDFFIKNEIMHLDDIDTENEKRFEQYLSKVKVIKSIGYKIVKFLEQIENFQKKLWLKKKFVIETNYCVTLDRVPEKLYEDIINNEQQIEEWKELFFVHELESSLINVGFTNPITKDFIKANSFLVLDTKYFSEEFKTTLLSSFENIDEQLDGILIKGDNFQAQKLIENKYIDKIQSIYIDPPYNTSASEIIYKNSYKHSSWLSLMTDRLILAKKLLNKNGIICVTIDDYELHNLWFPLVSIFQNENHLGTAIIRNNPQGRSTVKGFAVNHEYALFFGKSEAVDSVGRLPRTEKQNSRYGHVDENGNAFLWENFRKTGTDSNRQDRPKQYYPIYFKESDNTLRIPQMKWNSIKREWTILEAPTPDEIIFYPNNENGIMKVWKWGHERVINNPSFLKVDKGQKGDMQIFRKNYLNIEGSLPGTWWDKPKYSAGEYGTNLLTDFFGKGHTFSFPKSVFAVEDCLRVSRAESNSYILDFFGGSGTTAHAIINLNREDNGHRKYILVEMGNHFENVLVPRIKKAIYSKDWENGKPLSREGISHMYKYIYLESYEDTLNNIEMTQSEQQQIAIEEHMTSDAKESYFLSYMLDIESAESVALLNLDYFKNPFNYKLRISNGIETKLQKVDVVETFNNLLGVHIKEMDFIRGYQLIKGELRTGENVLIIWRNVLEKTNEDLEDFLNTLDINSRDFEYDRIYVNGDNHIENLKIDESKWKVVLIEEEFKRLMFDVEDM
ncbi:site-specific DNA-methyltransferase [Priestia megaterium]|uniref:site-specific DNA-methyltransferase n=1 Tax=Priestia megaterium TaxID=1404 RepID=UPI0010AC7048|nr:site-specific DNA-methyltransferase [Priestia megaterium]TJZ40059.1 site-specific DNA-methyltransferase [Priestia megaterium]